ncbi:MAG: hypothetical protein AAB882_01195 [Patescibacteria group bacterium]
MKTWYIIGVIVIIALGLWYFYGGEPTPTTSDTQASAIEQTQTSELTAGDTTADITADLAGTPDTSAALDADAAAAAQAVQGL